MEVQGVTLAVQRVVELLRVFDLDAEFLEMLNTTNSFLAGGSMTHLFVEKSPAEFDGDLDIWVPNSLPRDGNVTAEAVELFKTKMAFFLHYLRAKGYAYLNLTRNPLQQEYTAKTSTLYNEIRKVLCFEHPTTKRQIQVIFAFGDRTRILTSFDFSFCAVGFDPKKFAFFGVAPALTRQMKGVQMNTPRSEKRNTQRLEKYQKRGFTLVDS